MRQLRNRGAEVTRTIQRVYESWRLGELLKEFPNLTVEPIVNGQARISGTLAFSLQYQDLESIADAYTVAIDIPDNFPKRLPGVRETGGRIPKRFHTNPDATLCLGSPSRQRLALGQDPTLLRFIKKCVTPYLYAYSYFQTHGVLPFGELPHGLDGVRQDYANLFGSSSETIAEMVYLASLRKRHANRCVCPCGSGLRVGRCHNRKINLFRMQLGRSWFRREHQSLSGR